MALTPGSLRSDLKCGNGSISEGETCHKGPATKVKGSNGKRRRKPIGKATFAEKALIVGGAGATLAGGAVYAGSLAGQFVALTRTPDKGKDPIIKSFRRQFNSNNLGIARATSGAVASAGVGMIGAGFQMQGKRTRNRELSRTGRGLMTSGALGVTAGALGARDYVDRNNQLKKEVKQYTGKIRGAKRAYRKFENFAEQFARQAEEAKRRAQGRAGANRAVDNPYKDLGVSEKATSAEIRAAWKKKMQEVHPDRGGDPELAKKYNAAMAEIKRRRGDRMDIFALGFELDWDNLGAL